MTSINTEVLEEYQPFKDGDHNVNMPATVQTTDVSSNETSRLIEKSGNSGITKPSKFTRDMSKEINIEKNWPPFPSHCPCRPFLYQDINAEIPENLQKLIWMGYYTWLTYVLVLFFNLLGTIAYFLVNSSLESSSTLGTGILLMVLLPPAGFFCWFRPLYKAARSDSSTNYFIFFICMFAQIIVIAIQTIGINWLGSCGWFNGAITFAYNHTAGLVMMFVAALFTVMLGVHIIILVKVHKKYRNTDVPDMDRAEREMLKELRSSQNLRDVAASSMRSSAQARLSKETS